MKAIFIAATILLLLSFTVTDELTGRWQTKPSVKGNITSVIFKAGNLFEGSINRKPFVSGQYSFQDGIFSFVDNGCDGKKGVYKIIFFSNADSMRFEPIEDSCEQRRNGMSRIILGRVK